MLVIYGLASILLFQSAFPLILRVPLLAIIFFFMISIIKNKTPHPIYSALTYQGGYWLLHSFLAKPSKFTSAKVRFDAGLFLFIVLVGEASKKTLIIFNDQLSAEQKRKLRLIEKLITK